MTRSHGPQKRDVIRCLCILLTAVAFGGCSKPDTVSNTADPHPAPDLTIATGSLHDIDEEMLLELSWEHVAPTIEAAAQTRQSLEHILRTASTVDSGPSQYIAAILHLSEGRSEQALQRFQGIPFGSISAEYCYAPYRLHATMRPGIKNPFREPMLAAVA